MGLRFDPVGGGQFKEAVRQIIEAESQPLKALEARKSREEAKLKLFQDFKTRFVGAERAVSELNSFKKFREFKVDLGDAESLVTVTLDKERANPGSYELEIHELAKKTSVLSNGFSDPNEPTLGMGFIMIHLPDGSDFEMFVDSDKSSLNNVATMINSQKNAPIQAAVVKDIGEGNQPYRLLLSGKKQGEDNQIDFPDFYFLDGSNDFYFKDQRQSQNAVLSIDGFEMEVDSNHIKDFLPGVNLFLKGARPDKPFTLTISEDTAKISGKVKTLVEEVNKVLAFINDQNKLDEKSDTRSTFGGDSGLQAIEYRIRNLLHEAFPVGDVENGDTRTIHLNDIGLEFDKAGALVFKEERFQKQLDSNYSDVAEAITGPLGFANQIRQMISLYTQPGTGMLAQREVGLRARIKQIDDQVDFRSRILDKRKESLVGQFSRLQGSLSNLQRQGQYLSSALPSGGGGNLVSQLLGG